ncbi:Tyrosine-protein kinase ITK/TSK [Frankliniella fusca]|uniref:Tyrosine-protein kinase ITK/TSK n=1 Tax=Frankliniella fusca TaxID=407009 RepID=A0AAE1HUY3_9NEOP|nr:Tyrosine-protein kinase ITK/TSK [Frankliniella fusca]
MHPTVKVFEVQQCVYHFTSSNIAATDWLNKSIDREKPEKLGKNPWFRVEPSQSSSLSQPWSRKVSIAAAHEALQNCKAKERDNAVSHAFH